MGLCPVSCSRYQLVLLKFILGNKCIKVKVKVKKKKRRKKKEEKKKKKKKRRKRPSLRLTLWNRPSVGLTL